MPHRHRQEAAEQHVSGSVRHRAHHGSSTPRAGICNQPSAATPVAYENRSEDIMAVPEWHVAQSPHSDRRTQHQLPSCQQARGTWLSDAATAGDLQTSNDANACRHQLPRSNRAPLSASLRWLQLCLLILFAQDVFCFSLGYPFLPQYLAAHGYSSTATSLAFGIYGLVSILTLLLLLLISSRLASSSSSRGSDSQPRPGTKFWVIVFSTSLAAAAGAVNTVFPDSYAVLLATKAVQGAASALYFVYSLGLVATAYPAVYRTQAMAFVSAGLTLGDALGPVAGGVVYQAAGLQRALGMQPIASGVALLLLLGLLLWPISKRPWHIGPTLQQQQVQQVQRQKTLQSQRKQQLPERHQKLHKLQQQAYPLTDQHRLAASDSDLAAPLLPVHSAVTPAAPTTVPKAAADVQQGSHLLMQLLRNQGVLSLCLLALMCQAARTAVDLLLPLLLRDSVQPGVIGILFAGEALGSVVTPFAVDWLLQRSVDKVHHKAAQQKHLDSNRAGNSSTVSEASPEHQQSSTSSSVGIAAWLLFLSAVGMAVCCGLVLVAWQVPAAVCQLVCRQHQQQQNQQCVLPHWFCPAAAAGGSSGVTLSATAGRTSASNSSSYSNKQGLSADFEAPVKFRGDRLRFYAWWALTAYGTAVVATETLDNSISRSDNVDRLHSIAVGSFEILDSVEPIIPGAAPAGDVAERVSVLKFGLLQLLLTGLVLLIFGGCHSSCETLIYTVLTELVTDSPFTGKHYCISDNQHYELDGQLLDSNHSVDVVNDDCKADSSCPSIVGNCINGLDRCAGHRKDPLGQQQLQFVEYGSNVRCIVEESLVDEPTEVVMVLYVLFWVVGFTVGAAVAGVPSGSNMVQQQFTAGGIGLLLAISSLWSWRSCV